jgi:hypothetical protein
MRRTIGFSSCAVLALLLCLTASEFAAVARGIENTTPARRDGRRAGFETSWTRSGLYARPRRPRRNRRSL